MKLTFSFALLLLATPTRRMPSSPVTAAAFLVANHPHNPAVATHNGSRQRHATTTITRLFGTSSSANVAANKKRLDRSVYRPEKLDQHYDAVVIGSGIGGLTAAALLSQQPQMASNSNNNSSNNNKVLVLEQHYVAGGACHVFERKGGYRFATGIHYVGEMEDTNNNNNNNNKKKKRRQPSNNGGLDMKRILDTVTPVDDPVVWDRMDDHYETVFIGNRRYDLLAGQDALQQALVKEFPNEQDNIHAYYALAQRVRTRTAKWLVGLLKSMPLPLTRFLIQTRLYKLMVGGSLFRKCTTTSVHDGLKQITSNPDLQALLAYNYADYGTDPSHAPLWMQLMLATHYLDGAYYPNGGPSRIPQQIIRTIVDNGGKLLVSAPVERILVTCDADETTAARHSRRRRRVKGVQLQDGKVIECSVVISDTGILNTATKLLDDHSSLLNVEGFASSQTAAAALQPSPTGINLFVGLKGDAESLNLPTSNVWIHPSNDLRGTAKKVNAMTLDQALDSSCDPEDLGLLFVGCPCTKDSAWTSDHPDKSVMEIISFVPFHWFEKFASTFDPKTRSHGPEYEAAKTILAEKQWSRVVDILNNKMGAKLPRTLAEVDFYEVGSPLSFAHYYNAPRGAFYGLDHSLARFEPKTFFLRLRPTVANVPGLYLTGQDVMTDGFGPSMVGGLLCAAQVLGVTNPYSLLRR